MCVFEDSVVEQSLNDAHLTSYQLDGRVELLWAVAIALVFTFVRWTGNFLVLGHALIQQEKSKLRQMERLFEEIWLMFLSFGLLVASWIVFFNNDIGASLTNTLPIVHGWPENYVKFEVLALLRVETGWYVHQVTRGWSASGVPIDGLMFYHHIATLIIIRFCFWKNLLLLGVLTLSVFNISNPFLHLSKIAMLMHAKRMRLMLFPLFGLSFFVARIILLPLTILKMGYVDAYKEDYKSFGEELLFLGNTMMMALYALQVYWFYRIVKVLQSGRTGSTPKKSENKQTVFSDGKPTPNGKSKAL